MWFPIELTPHFPGIWKWLSGCFAWYLSLICRFWSFGRLLGCANKKEVGLTFAHDFSPEHMVPERIYFQLNLGADLQ